MNNSLWLRAGFLTLSVSLLGFAGCPGPIDESGDKGPGKEVVRDGQSAAKTSDQGEPAKSGQPAALAAAEDIAAARQLLDGLGANASYVATPAGAITEITVQDGSSLTPDAITLFGRLTDLQSLQIMNYRDLNDEMVGRLTGLMNLNTLALTNSVLGDGAVESIVKAFPNLTNLDLSYNPNVTNSVMKVICGLDKLERLTLVQDRFNDLGTSRLTQLENLKVLDIRGNMEAGDMTMEVLGLMPKLAVLKHRSTAVGDYGIEYLAQSKSLKSLLIQDFIITSQAGQYLAKLDNLTELEVFRCTGFGSEGVLALRGKPLTRLTLRGLPPVTDDAMAVFEDLPKLQRLYLQELETISDEGLKSLANLQALEVLDIWSVPQMGDATVEVIATLPKLQELSIRATGVTDAAVEKLLAMPSLQRLTFKENGSVTEVGLKKLADKKWAKLDTGQ